MCLLKRLPYLDVDSTYQFVCKLCDKRLVDTWIATDHVATDKHKRAMDTMNAEGKSSQYSTFLLDGFDILDQNVILRSTSSDEIGKCLLCRLVLVDSTHVLTHVGSSRHRRNLEWYQQLHIAMALCRFVSITETNPRCTRVPFEDDSYASLKPFPEFIVEDKMVNFVKSLPDEIVLREWDYFCSFCEARALSENELMTHLNSHQHIAVRQLKLLEKRKRLDHDEITRPVEDTDWKAAVSNGSIPPPPLNRRPIHCGIKRVFQTAISLT